MLHTNLEHVLSKADFEKILQENENVMICCGRMGPMCTPVYAAMTELKEEYKNIKFAISIYNGIIGYSRSSYIVKAYNSCDVHSVN